MIEINSKSQISFFNLKDLFKYKTLIKMFIKRDFVVFYKQTILGPLWYVIQPLANTIVFTIIFGKVAKIPTDEIPPFLFYMSGTVLWSYFSTCLTLNSKVFTQNADLFGKIYFPKLTVPVSHVIVSFLQFIIQFSLFACFLIYYSSFGANINFSFMMIFIPLIVVYIAIISIAFGTLLSSLTAKYRDLTFALSFGTQLWMFATPIVYPLSLVPDEYKLYIKLNPLTFPIECFRGIFFNNYIFNIYDLFLKKIFLFFRKKHPRITINEVTRFLKNNKKLLKINSDKKIKFNKNDIDTRLKI